MFPALSLGSLVNLASLLLNLIVLGSLQHCSSEVAFHQLPGKSADIHWLATSIPPKKSPRTKSPELLQLAPVLQLPCSTGISFAWHHQAVSDEVFGTSKISAGRCLGALNFEPTWTKCVVFYLCVVCSRSHIFGGPQDIFAMIQLPVFVFHIGSTERSDIISKWCPKTASTTSQSPRFRMLRNVTESTENTLETTIFHPNNSRQQISQRLETYLRKHTPLTNHSSDYDDSIGYDPTCAAKRPAWICKSSQICLAQSKMPLAAARSMIRPFSASWHPKSKRRKDSEINGSTGRWWMCSKNVYQCLSAIKGCWDLKIRLSWISVHFNQSIEEQFQQRK